MMEPSSLRSPTSTQNAGAVPVASGTPDPRGKGHCGRTA
jgi:hypothetical protein